MARTISIANQKGGVGKTTTAVNLSSALARAGKRVLLVDLDPQGNATTGCGVDKLALTRSSYDVLLEDQPMRDALRRSAGDEFDLLPTNTDLTAAEVSLMNHPMRERRLSRALEPLLADYDYVFIDCPPSLSMLTINALVASDGVLVPLQTEYYALEGLTGLLATIDKIRELYNPGLRLEGILRTMHDLRNRLAAEVSRQLIDHFGDRVFRTVIPRNVRVAEAPSHGQPVLLYDRHSRGALSYMALASEMLRRHAREAEAARSGAGHEHHQ